MYVGAKCKNDEQYIMLSSSGWGIKIGGRAAQEGTLSSPLYLGFFIWLSCFYGLEVFFVINIYCNYDFAAALQ